MWSWTINNFLFFSYSLLVQQLVEPVNWMKTIQNIFKGRTGNSKIYEVGPGRQLRAMIYRIDRTLLDNFTNLETWRKLLQNWLVKILNFNLVPSRSEDKHVPLWAYGAPKFGWRHRSWTKNATGHQALVDYLNLNGRQLGTLFQVLDEDIKAERSKAI